MSRLKANSTTHFLPISFLSLVMLVWIRVATVPVLIFLFPMLFASDVSILTELENSASVILIYFMVEYTQAQWVIVSSVSKPCNDISRKGRGGQA